MSNSSIILAATIVILGLLAALISYHGPKPDCPSGAEAKVTRSGWYCVVPPLTSAPR